MSNPDYVRARSRYYTHPCVRCGTVRVANPYQPNRSGLCRACSEADRRGARLTETDAFCSTCEQWRPYSEFSRQNTSRGWSYRCRACTQTARRRSDGH